MDKSRVMDKSRAETTMDRSTMDKSRVMEKSRAETTMDRSTIDKSRTLDKSRMVNKSMVHRQSISSDYEQNQVHEDASLRSTRPMPTDFDTFLPWACMQFHSVTNVVVQNVVQREYVAVAASKAKGKKKEPPPTQTEMTSLMAGLTATVFDDPDPSNVEVHSVYSPDNHLIHIKILKNHHVPRQILQILNLTIKFYPYLEAITIDSGMDKYTIHEIAKLLPLSHITELCFDGTYLDLANYYILLDNPNHLKHLSLSKCKINDAVVEKIAERLAYSQPASKILSILNLSTNRITDVGARALANALRSNRQLSYLNLAGNMITDSGSDAIFNVLLEFPLTYEEMIASKTRYIQYLKDKNDCINKLMADWKASGMADKLKKKPVKPVTPPSGRKKIPSGPEEDPLYAKARDIAKNTLGEYTESFIIDVVKKDGIFYSNGNNALAYINLSYNKLSAYSLRKIVKVFNHQNVILRRPRGLVNINIEGNPIDEQEANDSINTLNNLIDAGLSSQDRRNSFLKRPKSIAKGK